MPLNSPFPHCFPWASHPLPWQGKPRTQQETSELSEEGESLLQSLLPLAKTFRSKELALVWPLPQKFPRKN